MGKYKDEAADDARAMATEFIDEILLHVLDNGKASDDLFNDYSNGDSYHHETHIDRSYDLTEAAALLDDLSEHEETDKGLWEGCEPRRAIEVQAAFTYGNAVYSNWREIIDAINDEVEDFVISYEDDDGVTVSSETKARLKAIVEECIRRWS